MLRVHLFGKFRLEHGDTELLEFTSAKGRELLSYLLLNRNRSSARERVASDLWGDYHTTGQSRKYLRHTVWQIHTFLRGLPGLDSKRLLQVEPNWIGIPSSSELWLDVGEFEDAYESVKGKRGWELSDGEFAALKQAASLYVGDLLDGWYHDWCLSERERLLQIYLTILDKLIESCDARGRFEDGLSYGRRILQYDRARECTHRQMMRLYAKSGDRTGAIRQYNQCQEVLKDVLDVVTSERTDQLFAQIKSHSGQVPPTSGDDTSSPLLAKILRELRTLQTAILDLQQHVSDSQFAEGPDESRRREVDDRR